MSWCRKLLVADFPCSAAKRRDWHESGLQHPRLCSPHWVSPFFCSSITVMAGVLCWRHRNEQNVFLQPEGTRTQRASPWDGISPGAEGSLQLTPYGTTQTAAWAPVPGPVLHSAGWG